MYFDILTLFMYRETDIIRAADYKKYVKIGQIYSSKRNQTDNYASII